MTVVEFHSKAGEIQMCTDGVVSFFKEGGQDRETFLLVIIITWTNNPFQCRATKRSRGGAPIKPLLKKWWGTMLSNHKKVVGHVHPGPTYASLFITILHLL